MIVKGRKGFAQLIPVIGALASSGVLIPVLIILGIALAVLLFGPPTFITLLVGFFTSPMKTIGILLVIFAGAWLLLTRNFTVAAIIGAVGLLLVLGGQFGSFAIIGFTDGQRGTSTLLEGNRFYAYPKGGDPGVAFTSGRSYLLNDAGFLETFGNTCPPALEQGAGEWVLIGKGYISGYEVPIECASNGINFLYDIEKMKAAGFQVSNERWPGDTRVSLSAEMTYELHAPPVDIKEAAASASQAAVIEVGKATASASQAVLTFWQRFLIWLRGAFA